MSDVTTSKSLQGRLTRSSSGWILLSLPAGIQTGFFQALNAPGAELPRKHGRVNCHVSVMRPEELKKLGDPPINEIGKAFSIQLGKFVETNPLGWDEMDRVWFFRVDSPDLVKLRRSYGLPDLPKRNNTTIPFHMTIAVRRKGVLRSNTLAKESSFFTEEEWSMVPKVAMLTAQELQEQISNSAEQQLDPSKGSKTIELLGALAQMWDGRDVGIPNTPSALASILTLGILGGGAGYLGGKYGGRLINAIKPGMVDPARMSRTGMLAGAGLGAIPGISLGIGNYYAGKPVLTSSFLNDRGPLRSNFQKQGSAGAAFDPDHFTRLLNEDPVNKATLTPMDRAMATGLVQGAKHMPGRSSSPLITPVDIARMAVGMGSGYMSGSLVGGVFGSLMGLPQQTRDRLVQAGTFAGTVRSMLPLVFSG